MYVYKQTEEELWTVGFYGPGGAWCPDSDHACPVEAATRVRVLNGDGITDVSAGAVSVLLSYVAGLDLPSGRRVGLDQAVGAARHLAVVAGRDTGPSSQPPPPAPDEVEAGLRYGSDEAVAGHINTLLGLLLDPWALQRSDPEAGEAAVVFLAAWAHGVLAGGWDGPGAALAWQQRVQDDDEAGAPPFSVAVTDPDVLSVGVAQGWADPELDPAGIDWPDRQAGALVPYAVEMGRPLTPGPRTGITGRAGLGRWGENPMCDALVTATCGGVRYVLLIERGDGAGWALPGGSIEPGEPPADAAVRELAEETGLHLPCEARWQAWAARWVDDPRGTDESWAVTAPHHVDLGDVTAYGLPAVAGGDDAAYAAWIPAPDYPALHAHLTVIGGGVFPAHVGLLGELLGACQ